MKWNPEALPAALRDFFSRHPRVLVAVSGGVDSRALATAALAALGPRGVELVHFTGAHLTPAERKRALAWLEGLKADLGVAAHIIEAGPLDDPAAMRNGEDRCYHCKLALFSRARELADTLACTLVDGSNVSDTGEHRPGRRALRELGVLSPLAEAGLDKQGVRDLARGLGAEEPDQPARACLLTRLPYGMAADAALLERLGRAEDGLAELGLREFRVRMSALGAQRESGGDEVVVQVAGAERDRWLVLRDRAVALLAEQGFTLAGEVMDGAVSGYFDRRAGI